jgi:hypothetical protein
MIRDPRAVFDQLFGIGATPEARRPSPPRQEHSRLGDAVHQRSQAIARRRRSGPACRLPEDVREIERRIQKIEAQNASGEARAIPGAPIGVPDSYDEHVKLMFDMQVVAFAADVTRVVAFKLSRDVSNRVYPETGVNTGFHIASHHGEREDRIIDLAKINKYQSIGPYFLKKRRNARRDSNCSRIRC